MTSKINQSECLTATVKRYDFGTEYKGNTGVPAIVGKVDGRYVSHDDYAALAAHNELLSLQLQKSHAGVTDGGGTTRANERLALFEQGHAASQSADMTYVGKIRADDQPDGDPWPDVWATLPVGTRLYAALDHIRDAAKMMGQRDAS